MDSIEPALPAGINGDPAVLAIERALADLRRGRAIVIRSRAGDALVAAVETLDAALLERMRAIGGGRLALVLSAARTRAFAASAATTRGPASAFRISAGDDLATLRRLAGAERGALPDTPLEPAACTEAMVASVALAKHAALLPAMLVIDPVARTDDTGVVAVGQADIATLARGAAMTLEQVSRARVPIASAEHCELVLFRERRGDADHVAIVIGMPNLETPVLVRLHSSCLTGDLLGSLRCDCGSQLRGAIDAIAAAGGGVLLYLSQEGRGIGLANKLRAYALQDGGYDTIDADEQLGFEADERRYDAAAAMLRALGIGRIVLLTNNPEKIAALTQAGIDVVARQPLRGGETRHNWRYLAAKRDRAGHLLADEGNA